jgi:DNA-directed RNA polymerase subunit RPC12/RpoP
VSRLALTVRCTACGTEFDTGIRLDARDFARATLAVNYHRCPACGHRGVYHKDDYIPRGGDRPPPSPAGRVPQNRPPGAPLDG